jgi:hypothetical protein
LTPRGLHKLTLIIPIDPVPRTDIIIRLDVILNGIKRAGLFTVGDGPPDARRYEPRSGRFPGGSTGVFLTVGQIFDVDVNANDLWNAGPLPRWSNGDGLLVKLYATGADESGAYRRRNQAAVALRRA